MKIESQVPSLDHCCRLKELGMPQGESIFGWRKASSIHGRIYMGRDWEKEGTHWHWEVSRLRTGCVYAAPTVAELGEMLPTWLSSSKPAGAGDKWVCYARLNPEYTHTERADTEANARAKMLIWLVENGYLIFEGGD